MNVREPEVTLVKMLALIRLVPFIPDHFLESVKGQDNLSGGF